MTPEHEALLNTWAAALDEVARTEVAYDGASVAERSFPDAVGAAHKARNDAWVVLRDATDALIAEKKRNPPAWWAEHSNTLLVGGGGGTDEQQ